MNYNDAINSIGSRLRFGIKPGLDRIRGLLCRMGNPQDIPEVIHIAGTNGKGSTGEMIARGFISAGVKVGHFSSPYLEKPTEYIRINGNDITEQQFTDLFEQVSAYSDGSETEFEIICAMAFLCFAQEGCEVAVIECGMGGLQDATNVITKPKACVLTNISMDHTAFLGDTVEAITENKCGIIKSGCTVVSAPKQNKRAFQVIAEKCAQNNVKLINCTDVLGYLSDKLEISMLGEFQKLNAITAFEVLKCFDIDEPHIKKGISNAFLPARCEVFGKSPLVILDGCHNPGAAKLLSASLDELLQGEKAVALFGMINTKDYDDVIATLSKHFSLMFSCDGFRENAVSSELLYQSANKYTESKSLGNYENALSQVLDYYRKNNVPLIIFGSLYLSGKLRPMLQKYFSQS